ncbi:MAG: hypothetical protein PHV37_08530 [Candidatus Gastranaerophilales bacterium]|nr:hypothetical protein [Candidatus Gastranaerophilales bacterium]
MNIKNAFFTSLLVVTLGSSCFASVPANHIDEAYLDSFYSASFSLNIKSATNDESQLLALCDKILAIMPENTDANRLKAQIYFNEKKYDLANIYASKVLLKYPNNQNCNTIKGVINLKNGDRKLAKSYFGKININDKNQIENMLTISDAYCDDALKTASIKSIYQCTKYYTYARISDKSRADTYYKIGVIVLKMGAEDQAKSSFKNFIKRTPVSQEAYLKVSNAFWIYSTTKDRYKDVAQNIEKAIAINPELPLEYTLRLAACYRHLNRENDANILLKTLYDKQ